MFKNVRKTMKPKLINKRLKIINGNSKKFPQHIIIIAMNLIAILLIILIVIVICYSLSNNTSEHFTDSDEAIRNLASLYNTGEMKATNIYGTQKITTGDKFSVNSDGTLTTENINVNDSIGLNKGGTVNMLLKNDGNLNSSGILNFGNSVILNSDVPLKVYPDPTKNNYFFVNRDGKFGYIDNGKVRFVIDKNGNNINPDPQFVRLVDITHAGNDVSSYIAKDVEQCKKYCAGTPSCTHVTTKKDNTGCWLKGPIPMISSGIVTGVRQYDESIGKGTSFKRYENMSLSGNDLPDDLTSNPVYRNPTVYADINDCEKECLKTNDCWFYTHGRDGSCKLKRGAIDTTMDTYIKY